MTPRMALESAAPYLREFRAALDTGRLVICGQCVSFRFAHEAEEIGECRRQSVEAWPFVPFQCVAFQRREKKAA